MACVKLFDIPIERNIMITSEEIKRRLWDGATDLRGSMDASRYKDYMLGLMFYKFLSDKTLETFKITAGVEKSSEKELVEEYVKAKEEYGEELEKMIQNVLGYFVSPEYLYQIWLKDISDGNFEVQEVSDSLNNFERSIIGSGEVDDFKGLFSSSTLDLSDTALGSNLHERSKNIKSLILLFADLNMVDLQKGDILGDAYEYLIGQFAMESGKKAGEFYTPHQVSEVMAQIVAKTTAIKSIYDPTVGSGSLLLTVKKHLGKDEQKDLSYYGQEKNTATYNLTRMNLLLHGVRPEKMTVKNGDTLSNDWPEDPENPNDGVQFDAVVMNPPYSVKNWNKAELKVSDPRFEIGGALPPDSKGDYAFLLHGLYHLGIKGTMGIVLPHGVLFRGSSEGEIRKRLIDRNQIDAVIGLPSMLFTNTGIPVAVIILKKSRAITDPVLMIDASNHFIKVGKQNVLQEKDIAKIVDVYTSKEEIAGFSHLASLKEIVQNEYNMNIPRYVQSLDDDIAHDVDAHLFGGIPEANIKELKILHELVPDVLAESIEEVRPAYVGLNTSIKEMTNAVLKHENIVSLSKDLELKITAYIDKFWNELKSVTVDTNLTDLEARMLLEIKQILKEFDHLDVYSAYQIIAEIWKNALTHDTELIGIEGFYNVARLREANMVSKGTGKNKREEQDGWNGKIIPNDLIAKMLYSEVLKALDNKRNKIQELDMELSDLVEAAKVEDSTEYDALFDIIKRDKEDEPTDSFDKSKLKSEVKSTDKQSDKYTLLKQVDRLIANSAKLSNELKSEVKELRDAVEERILVLTDEEIDSLLHYKWFGKTVNDMTSLIHTAVKSELTILQKLEARYADTLDSIDGQIENLLADFEVLKNDLEVR